MGLDHVSGDIYEVGGVDGAAFLLDSAGVPSTHLFPFVTSADSEQITATPYIPDGVTLGPMVDTPYGFKWNMSNGNDLYILDGQDAKLADIMPDWTAEGFRIVLRMPKANIPAYDVDDVLRIPKIILGGDFASFNWNQQGELTPEDIAEGAERPAWAVNSYAVYHKTKRNNRKENGVLVDDYRTGKCAHLPRPVAAFMDGVNKVGHVWGWWEHESLGDGTRLLVKCFSKLDTQAGIAALGGAPWTHVAVDATVGYTSVGASALSGTQGNLWIHGAFVAGDEGTATELYWLANDTALSSGWRVGIYTSATGDPDAGSLIHDSGQRAADREEAEGALEWLVWELSAGPTISSGSNYFMAAVWNGSARNFYYDTSGAANGGYRQFSFSSANPLPDPSATSTILASIDASTYVVYGSAAGGGGDSGPLNLGMGMGM